MPVKNKLCVVQFHHPGNQAIPKPRNGKVVPWNMSGKHKRKFMRCVGDYVDKNGNLQKNKDLMFWGEWEAESQIITKYNSNPQGAFPKYLQKPVWPCKIPNIPLNSNCCFTTDPFVFTGAFVYSHCRQATNHNTTPTQLAKLERGSLILFGSNMNGAYFAIDTVFVVDEIKQYTAPSVSSLKSSVPDKNYLDITQLAKANLGTSQYSCYLGATYQKQVNGMYSFSPCKLCPDSVTIGFERLKLMPKDMSNIEKKVGLKKLFSRNLQSFTYEVVPPTVATKVWDEIRALSRKQGLYEGVRFQY